MSFVLSKVLWIFLAPANLLIALLVAGLALEASPRQTLKKTGRFFCFFVVFCLAAVAILPIGTWATTPLENRFAFNPPARIDGIVVLGGDEQTEISDRRGQPTAHDSMRRYVLFKNLSRRYPDAKLVFTGGSGHLRPYKDKFEADIARDIMESMDVPTKRVVFENKSRNTNENARFAADLVHPGVFENWLLVTSAVHMPRAMGCFRQEGWNVFAAPAGYFTNGAYSLYFPFRFEEQMHLLTIAFHEYVGLIAYRLMGRTNALWPG